MHTVLSYDVCSNKRRARLHKRLKAFLHPVQMSVFEGRVSAAERTRLEDLVLLYADQNTDSVRIYSMCRACRGLTRLYGVAAPVFDPDQPVLL